MLERSHTVHTLRMLPRLGLRFLASRPRTARHGARARVAEPRRRRSLAIVAAVAAAAIPLLGQSSRRRARSARAHAYGRARTVPSRRAARPNDDRGARRGWHDRARARRACWRNGPAPCSRSSARRSRSKVCRCWSASAWSPGCCSGTSGTGGGTGLLLQIYWLLNLPTLGYELALIAREYPAYRSTILRVLEPLGAPDFRSAAIAQWSPSHDPFQRRPKAYASRRAASRVRSGRTLDSRRDRSRHRAGHPRRHRRMRREPANQRSSGCCSDGIVPSAASCSWTASR